MDLEHHKEALGHWSDDDDDDDEEEEEDGEVMVAVWLWMWYVGHFVFIFTPIEPM